jgi:hypothetical protein
MVGMDKYSSRVPEPRLMRTKNEEVEMSTCSKYEMKEIQKG